MVLDKGMLPFQLRISRHSLTAPASSFGGRKYVLCVAEPSPPLNSCVYTSSNSYCSRAELACAICDWEQCREYEFESPPIIPSFATHLSTSWKPWPARNRARDSAPPPSCAHYHGRCRPHLPLYHTQRVYLVRCVAHRCYVCVEACLRKQTIILPRR